MAATSKNLPYKSLARDVFSFHGKPRTLETSPFVTCIRDKVYLHTWIRTTIIAFWKESDGD